MNLYLKYPRTDKKRDLRAIRYYYFGKYISKKEAEERYVKGNPLVVSLAEPYPIQVKLELHRLELRRMLHEA